jgi:O-antigen/teichoic acid export membrane protein
MLKTLRRLAGLSVVYTIGDIATKGMSFLLLPLYARFLTPEDYGILAITGMIQAFLGMLTSFGMIGAILRFYYLLADDMQRRRFYGAMGVFLLLVPGCIVLVLLQFGRPLFTVLFRQVPFDPYIRLALWVVLLNTAFALLPPALFRAREQATRYVGFNLFMFAATTFFTIWFVVIQRRGALGSVLAQLVSALIVAIVASAILLKEVIPNLRWGQLRPAIAYSMPLVPHFLSHWALGVSDRAILERYVNLGQLGIYSLGYQFGVAYQTVVTSINNSLIPMFSRAAVDEKEFRLLPPVLTYYVLAITTIALAGTLLAGDIIVLVMPVVYHDARTIVPWVVLGYLAMGLYYLPMNTLAMTAGKTRAVPFVTMGAATVNIGLNLLLVPQWGILAAAVNTTLGYAVLAGLMFFLAQRTRPLDYEYSRLGKIAFSGVLLFALGRLLMQFNPLVNLCIGLVLVMLLPFALKLLRFWTEQEEEHIARLRQRLVTSWTPSGGSSRL